MDGQHPHSGELKRGLKNRHIQLIALGGAIGTGLFLGSVVGINSLLYGVEACAGFLDAFGKLFDQGRLPLPDGLREVPLEQGVEQYRAVNEGTCEKIILVP